MKKKVLIILFLALFVLFVPRKATASPRLIPIRSIDTMKISRDIAREKLHDPSFHTVIADHMHKIAEMGVTHVAIDTPYDDEFKPLLERWVTAAREEGLLVWYRGNFSGWEGWFSYPDISRAEHLTKLKRFLEKNPHLFMDGDIFTACPECENGDPNAPWKSDPTAFRKFMIDEYKAMNAIFAKHKLQVITNFNSMNGELALRVYDKETTKALGGIVGIDHYVATPEQLVEDILIIARRSGGKVVLGEIGVPIPNIHGDMPGDRQAEWMAIAFDKIRNIPEVIGVNYWTSWGGSTALWYNNGESSKVSKVVKNFYTGQKKTVRVLGKDKKPVANAVVKSFNNTYKANSFGEYDVPYLYSGQNVEITAPDHRKHEQKLVDGKDFYPMILQGEKRIVPWWEIFIEACKSVFRF